MSDQHEHEQPTTTHSEWGAGNPRLLISHLDGDRLVYDITTEEVRIGSAADADVVLAGAEPVHATIQHDERDEYVLTMHAPGLMNANPDTAGEGPDSEILRTGARFTAGEWTLVFSRQEFADHGRPFGGREGGEYEDQREQPQRPSYQEGEQAPGPADEVKDG